MAVKLRNSKTRLYRETAERRATLTSFSSSHQAQLGHVTSETYQFECCLVSYELEEIRAAIVAERAGTKSVTWKVIFTNPRCRRRVVLACAIQAFRQTSGFNVIGYCGPRIYAIPGFVVSISLFIIGRYGALAQL